MSDGFTSLENLLSLLLDPKHRSVDAPLLVDETG